MAISIQRQIKSPQVAYDEMLGISTSGDVKMIPIDKLIPYKNQPFKAYSSEKLSELSSDILQNGILSPIIVRPCSDEPGFYEIIAGHNRTGAAQLAAITEVPCIIKELDDTAAALIMVNTNLNQRHELLPSEKAFAYKLQQDCLKSMDTPVSTPQSGESIRNVQRYIRLSSLDKKLLNLVDESRIAVLAGVELTWLELRNQEHLHKYLYAKKSQKLDVKQAIALRELEKEKDFYSDYLDEFFNPPKKPNANIKLCFSKVAQYIPTDCENAEEYICEALKFYKNNGGNTD